MPRSEYKYTGGLQHLDPWENPGPNKRYDRQKVKEETCEIIDDVWPALSISPSDDIYADMENLDYWYYREIAEEYYAAHLG